MTDTTTGDQLRLRSAIELIISYHGRLTAPSVVTVTGPTEHGFGAQVTVCQPRSRPALSPYQPLTTAQQLALSVLLGEPVPLAVLLGACEDAGVFPAGVLTAVAEKSRAEERERIAAVCREGEWCPVWCNTARCSPEIKLR